jgi:hypothetical protein
MRFFHSSMKLQVLLALLGLTLASPAPAQEPEPTPAADRVPQVAAGAFIVERPTLLSLGFEWKIQGDANRNAAVAVTYRKRGEVAWHKALPLMRIQHEFVPGPKPQYGDVNYYNYTTPNMFAGSILNLVPDTDYECHFVLTDPDGVGGQAEQTVTVHTRAKPVPAPGGHVYHVYPFGFKGKMQQPAFIGLLTAYYTGSDESDHENVLPARVQPGDTILVHAGVYKDDSRFIYGGVAGQDQPIAAYGMSFDGTYYLTQSGTPQKPIVIKAAGDGEVVFDGNGAQTLFNLEGANYNYFEGITVRNTNVAFLLGIKGITGSSGFTLVHSRVYDVGRVVQEDWAGSRDFYIADNVFIGRHLPDRITSWGGPRVWGKYPGYPAPITSEYAVKVYGQGHVVAHNYIADFHDAIDDATYGNPSDKPEEQSSSVDFYGNDMYNNADNCIELDGGVYNVRAFENRCVNHAGGGFSTQPIFGGPAYIFRNLDYSSTTGGALKLLDTPSGVLIYNNTFIGAGGALGPASNIHFRNNLIVGDGWKRPVFTVRTYTPYSTSDYNGFGLNPVPGNFAWDGPPFDNANGSRQRKTYDTLADYQKGSGQDAHSIVVGLDTFRNVRPTDENNPPQLYNPEDFDFQLKLHSAAIDKGIELPTITDGFKGRAPDLGAYEIGVPTPHYGPDVWPVGDAPTQLRSMTGPPRGK